MERQGEGVVVVVVVVVVFFFGGGGVFMKNWGKDGRC